jgi:hypothetical protein
MPLMPDEIRAIPRKRLPDARALVKANPMRTGTLTSHRTMNWGQTPVILWFPFPATIERQMAAERVRAQVCGKTI